MSLPKHSRGGTLGTTISLCKFIPYFYVNNIYTHVSSQNCHFWLLFGRSAKPNFLQRHAFPGLDFFCSIFGCTDWLKNSKSLVPAWICNHWRGHNQRLEFLGDTVLQLITTDYLYKHFPYHHEGHLSILRTCLVSNKVSISVLRNMVCHNGLSSCVIDGTDFCWNAKIYEDLNQQMHFIFHTV